MPEPQEIADYASNQLPRQQRRHGWKWAAPTDLLWIACIIVLLVVIIMPHVGRPSVGVVKRKVTEAQISTLAEALHQFHADNGRYPTQAEGLDALIHQPPAMPAWRQVLEEPPTDGWGNEIRYELPGKKNPASFDLRSAGRDGIIGTADDIIK